MIRNHVDHSVALQRDLFLNEEDWQRAQLEGGTFDLHGGFRVSVGLPMAVRISETDVDPVELKWSVSFEPVEQQPAVIERKEFWWITSEGWRSPNPTPAEVTFRDDVAYQVVALGADEIYRPEECVLIERVLPPGRAAAAVEKLGEIAGEKWPWIVVEEISAILQGGENQA